ncbi:hypothetical protein WJX73_005170 [Symbiochloris irregularis]|uniref:Multifunctional methyltransferase subunit TRM112-like protein n=1 Tax=Symbiochloris irregularis TaxID=706552 RepID=A0AAW1PMM8_9CHLO
MKLITHNMLSCHIKGVKNGFPFKIQADKVESRDADFDPQFLRNIFGRIEWDALRDAAASLGVDNLPQTVSAEMLEDDDFLQAFHHALLEVTLEEGALICPETGRKFSVSKGIPNLLLNEDET